MPSTSASTPTVPGSPAESPIIATCFAHRLLLLMESTTPPSALVAFRNLTFGYGEHAVLDNVSLTIPRGKVTALIGPMGAGKTTTLRLMGGECRAQTGQMLR